jgi:hypothetical protein
LNKVVERIKDVAPGRRRPHQAAGGQCHRRAG